MFSWFVVSIPSPFFRRLAVNNFGGVFEFSTVKRARKFWPLRLGI